MPIHPLDPEPRKVQRVVELLLDGGVVICPTDTVHAFICSANRPQAIERIAKLKGVRPNKAELSLICKDLSQLAGYTKPVGTPEFRLMKSVLPGPYTFILPASAEIPKLFRTNRRTVGIRVPDHAVPRALVNTLGHAVVAASVHDPDRVVDYTTDPERMHELLASEVDMVIDSGAGGIEASTVIDLSGEAPVVVRLGKGPIEGLL